MWVDEGETNASNWNDEGGRSGIKSLDTLIMLA